MRACSSRALVRGVAPLAAGLVLGAAAMLALIAGGTHASIAMAGPSAWRLEGRRVAVVGIPVGGGPCVISKCGWEIQLGPLELQWSPR